MTIDLTELGECLADEARRFTCHKHDNEDDAPRTYLIADFEYAWDRGSHSAYCTSEGKGAEGDIRWPFHRIAAAAWIVLRFRPGTSIPEISEPIVLAADEMDEREIVATFFDALCRNSDPVLATWGGEAKDFAVLRRCACDHSLVLPRQLRELSPRSLQRLDLCSATSVMAARTHLPEYACAASIPSKPWPSKSIGRLVETGMWKSVRDQVLADVMTTTVIALQHLVSHAVVACDLPRTNVALAERALAAIPASRFLESTFRPWARGRLHSSSLRGKVYRAA